MLLVVAWRLSFFMFLFQVDGGSNLSIKIRWTQKLSFFEGQYTLNVPFTFPDYVTPSGKKLAKKEKIEINVNSGTDGQVLCKSTSHPLKVLDLAIQFCILDEKIIFFKGFSENSLFFSN